MLGAVAVFAAAGAIRAAQQGVGWSDPVVIGLLAAAGLCLVLALWAFGFWGALWGPTKQPPVRLTGHFENPDTAPQVSRQEPERQFAHRTPKEL